MSDTLIPWVCGTDAKNASSLYIYIWQPIINLFNLGLNPPGTIIAWAIVIFWFYLLYFIFPPNFLNSQGGFIDFFTSIVFAFLLYLLTSILIIFFTRASLCEAKETLAKRWAVLAVNPPYYLEDRVEDLRLQNSISITVRGTDPKTGKLIDVTY